MAHFVLGCVRFFSLALRRNPLSLCLLFRFGFFAQRTHFVALSRPDKQHSSISEKKKDKQVRLASRQREKQTRIAASE